MTKIIFVRHGYSESNKEKRFCGQRDVPLDALGHSQAEQMKEYLLKNYTIDAIYSSDLLRAHNTAVPHAEIHGLSIVDSVDLREVFLGDWEGCAVEKLLSEHHEEFAVKWLGEFGSFAFPGGESVYHAACRFYDKLLEIAKENEGKTVLITAHAAVIRAFWCKINGVSPLEAWGAAFPFSTNAAYSRCTFDGEKFIPLEYSCDSHFKKDDVTKI
jgi:broad specificity phosphatase PhoE